MIKKLHIITDELNNFPEYLCKAAKTFGVGITISSDVTGFYDEIYVLLDGKKSAIKHIEENIRIKISTIGGEFINTEKMGGWRASLIITVRKYNHCTAVDKAKGRFFPKSRGTLLPSFDRQAGFGFAVNWLGIRFKVTNDD